MEGWNPGISITPNNYRTIAFAISFAAHILAVLCWPVPRHHFGSPPYGAVSQRALEVRIVPRDRGDAVQVPINTQDMPPVPTKADMTKAEMAKAGNPTGATAPQTFRDKDSFALVPNYYPARDLTQMPSPLTSLRPQPVAGDDGIGGKVSIRLWINTGGELDRASLVDSELPPEFAEAVLGAFRKMRFKPGTIDGVSVPAWVDIVVEYRDLHGEREQQPSTPQ